MSFIQREIDRIRESLVASDPRYDELYAAQQALEWALEPSGIKPPYAMIMGTQEGSGDCSAPSHPFPS
ncbi:hypothetical protein LB542_19800 [Mesorhizobium sp. BR1-1-9]|uniref:hypothetical protein n=1 Tax=Mesorhizobium sp. BR1-1-9 TaxID=2876646 RepID=UPI001CD151F0|nr:hypothetical protein [Mesorhizobium sp. BR1-1-9]MBZ9873095.1 hypothetical protein [Mesorhizobium sp. BR1-1-9]